jgi:hypothetical protein
MQNEYVTKFKYYNQCRSFMLCDLTEFELDISNILPHQLM